MKITIKGPKMDPIKMEFSHDMKAEEILNLVKDKMPYPIYGCKVDNSYRGLLHNVHRDCTVEFLDIRTSAIWYVYQNSLILLFIKAVHDVLDKSVLVSVNNSLSKGLFITLNRNINQKTIKLIEDKMLELVKKDIPIKKEHMTKEKAIELAKKHRQQETCRLLESIPSLNNVEIYSLEDEVEIFYNFLVPSTGYLQYFELKNYKNGLLLRFPHQSNPLIIPEFEEQNVLYKAFSEVNRWGQLTNTNYVVDLNEQILTMGLKELYLMQEALHEKKISDIADEILKSKKRVVLICGPSSSGKTSFANRLSIQLKVNGLSTLCLGTDDYFVNRDQTPLDENGQKDYESIKAVDIKLFTSDIQKLLNGQEVDLPYFDFTKGEKIFGDKITKIDKKHVLIIEGIHALNEKLTEGISENEKFKIYISPFSPISIDHHNRIPTTDCRMLRRMVRDYQFRNRSVKQTIAEWPKVRAGEEKNIFPYADQAEVFFNSNCIYEFAVLKKYAEPLLREVKPDEEEYAEAQRMLSFLRFFDVATDDDKIVNNSIIREFIGGSILVH
ncbi:MAG: nucleoside kinase [Bacillota bacterium]|jgi:uridine kinase|nr:nucleoside kinase [Bacillota bacterium]NLL26041.1 nucleoside kinase [Erysipelotrichia bacterium]